MILIGQYDSPFVRRVGIALRLYGLEFEHRPWSSFGDADKIRTFNPLTKVPTLVLDDGEVLTDSHLMLDYLDSLVAPERRMFPAAEPERRRVLRITGLATGLADKAVSLFYELKFHAQPSARWISRCGAQIGGALALLDNDRAARSGAWWFGPDLTHADIAVAAALRFLSEGLPGRFNLGRHAALASHCQRCEALPVFREISQPFIPPA